jgi:hypothetical protein
MFTEAFFRHIFSQIIIKTNFLCWFFLSEPSAETVIDQSTTRDSFPWLKVNDTIIRCIIDFDKKALINTLHFSIFF